LAVELARSVRKKVDARMPELIAIAQSSAECAASGNERAGEAARIWYFATLRRESNGA